MNRWEAKAAHLTSNDRYWHLAFNAEWQLPVPPRGYCMRVRVGTYVWIWLFIFRYMEEWVCIHMCVKNMIMCMFCVCTHAWEECVLCCAVCLNALSVVCLPGCVCAHVCLYDGGGGRAGIKHTRSTSERLGGPSPALMATHVNPTTQKIGQWNTTHSHTDIHTHIHQYQLKESQSASRASALSPVCDPRSTLPRTSSRGTDTSSGLEQQD